VNLKEYIYRNRISFDEFAARIKMSPLMVRRYAMGQSVPRLDVGRRIVEATGGAVTLEELGYEIIYRIPHKFAATRDETGWTPLAAKKENPNGQSGMVSGWEEAPSPAGNGD
jgi:transcriptional regulator with XRE-family HTH domain